ncbi:hypothetical protein FQR65_LT07557 [Abscondita terminalis]|nr:hypothetical protein FQR65_LT07557 [Abscondita terminalis]
MIFQERILQYLLVCAGSLANLQSGLNDGWPSFALPELQSNASTVPLTNEEGLWIATAYPIGTTIGSILLPFTIDMFGRKTMLLVGTLPFFGTWMVIAFLRTVRELLIARFVGGMLQSIIYICVPVYLAEIVDPEIRGFLITITKSFYIVGILLNNILGSLFGITTSALISSALALGVCLCILVPESPYFYIIKNKDDKARISLEMFKRNASIDSIRNAVDEQKVNNGKWSELFTVASNRKSLTIILGIRVFQQLSGGVSLLYYAQTLFVETSIDINPIIFLSIYFALPILLMIINGKIIDKFGRKPMLVMSMSIIIVSLSILSVYFSLKNMTEMDVSHHAWCPVSGLFLYVVGNTLGLNNIPYLIVSEIFPLHVKNWAIASANVFYGISVTLVSKFFQYTKDEFGLHLPFIVFTICSICSLPFFIFCVPETKKQTLEEIEKKLRCKQNSNVD